MIDQIRLCKYIEELGFRRDTHSEDTSALSTSRDTSVLVFYNEEASSYVRLYISKSGFNLAAYNWRTSLREETWTRPICQDDTETLVQTLVRRLNYRTQERLEKKPFVTKFPTSI
jgi:hypothetical protein